MTGNNPTGQKTWFSVLLLILSICFSYNSSAQYFGRNKVNYKQFDFRVIESPHFEIYHYLQNDGVKNRITQQAEQWYRMHQLIFRDTFKEKNPMILYKTTPPMQRHPGTGATIRLTVTSSDPTYQQKRLRQM